MGSAMQLNSATGVMFPGTAMVPDMRISSWAVANVWGEWVAARAKVVAGPMPRRVMVFGGFEARRERMRLWEGVVEGV